MASEFDLLRARAWTWDRRRAGWAEWDSYSREAVRNDVYARYPGVERRNISSHNLYWWVWVMGPYGAYLTSSDSRRRMRA